MDGVLDGGKVVRRKTPPERSTLFPGRRRVTLTPDKTTKVQYRGWMVGRPMWPWCHKPLFSSHLRGPVRTLTGSKALAGYPTVWGPSVNPPPPASYPVMTLTCCDPCDDAISSDYTFPFNSYVQYG